MAALLVAAGLAVLARKGFATPPATLAGMALLAGGWAVVHR